MDGFNVDAHRAAIDQDGYTIIRDFLSPEDLGEVRRVLAFYLGRRAGRNNFEGYRTERVYTLVARGRIFWKLAVDAFTKDNGGTEVIPRSHLWTDAEMAGVISQIMAESPEGQPRLAALSR